VARPIPEKEVTAIEDVVRRHPDGVTAHQIASALPVDLPLRTLQYRLQRLVEDGRLAKEGERRWTKYYLPVEGADEEETAVPQEAEREDEGNDLIPLSEESAAIRVYVRQPREARKPCRL